MHSLSLVEKWVPSLKMETDKIKGRGYKIQVFMTFVNVSCFKGSYLSFSFLQYVTPPGGNVFDRSYSFIAFSLFCRG